MILTACSSKIIPSPAGVQDSFHALHRPMRMRFFVLAPADLQGPAPGSPGTRRSRSTYQGLELRVLTRGHSWAPKMERNPRYERRIPMLWWVEVHFWASDRKFLNSLPRLHYEKSLIQGCYNSCPLKTVHQELVQPRLPGPQANVVVLATARDRDSAKRVRWTFTSSDHGDICLVGKEKNMRSCGVKRDSLWSKRTLSGSVRKFRKSFLYRVWSGRGLGDCNLGVMGEKNCTVQGRNDSTEPEGPIHTTSIERSGGDMGSGAHVTCPHRSQSL